MDPTLRTCAFIHIVESNSRATDSSQKGKCVQQRFIDFGVGAHNQRIHARRDREKRVVRHRGMHDFCALLKPGGCLFGEVFSDYDERTKAHK